MILHINGSCWVLSNQGKNEVYTIKHKEDKMKVKKYNRVQHYISKNGKFSTECLYKYVPENNGTVNIEAVMNFSSEQHRVFEMVFCKTMEYIDKNIKVELGKFGTLQPCVECETKTKNDQFELNPESIKKVRVKFKPSKQMNALMEEMLENIEIV